VSVGVETRAMPLHGEADAGLRRRRAWRVLSVALPFGAVLISGVLLLIPWPDYWLHIAAEQTPMTWLSSVTLVLCAASAADLGLRRYVRHGRRAAVPAWLLSAGFTFLAVDERFALHERLRDGLLAPAGVRLPLVPWIGPGDFLLIGYAVVGFALLPLALRLFRDDPVARRLFVAGVLLATATVGADSVDPARLDVVAERLEQTVEELAEFAAGTLLLLGLLRLRLLSGDYSDATA
jgi:hypothetical protein